MAELAPTPTARVRIATVVKAGFFFSMRSAYFKSCRNVCISRGPPEGLYVPGPGLVHQMKVVLLVNTTTAQMMAKKSAEPLTFTFKITKCDLKRDALVNRVASKVRPWTWRRSVPGGGSDRVADQHAFFAVKFRSCD